MTLIIDTGSSLAWVQCNPCNSSQCYPQRLPLSEPRTSSSYSPVPCDSQDCRDLAAGIDGDGCTGYWDCAYQLHYGSGATPTAVYSSDALTLGPGAVVESFHFGCGHDQKGKFDMADGVLGLGRLLQSLAWQASAPHGGGVFSHCLPPTGSSTEFLYLGASNDTSRFVCTPLLTMDEQPWFYQLMLAGISVGGQPLDIPPAVFREGVITDSGTMISLLQETAYEALRTVFRSAMAEYPLAPPVGGLDTGGATVHLDASSGVLDGCLAFWSSTGDEYTGVIGSVSQRTIEVLYDMPGGKVGFRTAAC
ncbi:aspartyl protease family protein At5g10770-like [Miscanthus floridulus]|uniref:aspartyl protease family protein At5g10770-like n=1 Tax=Miscanthus floridulus TaxID=154761 RepID=UPI0034592C32